MNKQSTRCQVALKCKYVMDAMERKFPTDRLNVHKAMFLFRECETNVEESRNMCEHTMQANAIQFY
jgi:hypothetical protein